MNVTPTGLQLSKVSSIRFVWGLYLLVFILGALVRVIPSAGFKGIGFDEALYRQFVIQLDTVGIREFPAICEAHIAEQSQPDSIAKLPPTRFLYIFSGWLWKRVAFGDSPPLSPSSSDFTHKDPALVSLHRVSCAFSLLLFGLSAVFAGRALGVGVGLGVFALMAFAPLQLQMAQHALIDGFFAFWATLSLWLLWENLQRRNHAGWLIAFAISLTLMVLTKENSFFVYVALGGLIVGSRWLGYGSATWRLTMAMLIGPLIGVVLLTLMSGGVSSFVEIYRLLVSKAQNLDYAIRTGDGPWHRYLVDLMLVSPIVLCAAIGGMLNSLRKNQATLFLSLFIVLTYTIMCNVTYGMNLRYATIWDFPLRALAVAQVVHLIQPLGSRKVLAAATIIAVICTIELHQYILLFHDAQLYELVTEGLLRGLKILK